jgi:hypothetical protein
MKTQPLPSVTGADVQRVVRRDFSAGEEAEILSLLSEYGVDHRRRETNRVRLAVLKLAAGDAHRVKHYVECARNDYRDVLSWAEYPNYCKLLTPWKLPQAQVEQTIDADWAEYQEWLGR